MAPSIRCSRAKNVYLAPAVCWFQEERGRRYRLSARILVVSLLSKALAANMAKALTLARDSDSTISTGNLGSSLSTL